MKNISLVEQLLHEYTFLTHRIIFMENLKQKCFETDAKRSSSYYEDISINNSRKENQDIIIDNIIDRVKCVDHELEKLRYTKRIVDDCLEMLKLKDERLYTIVKKYYIQNVRMEDIADMLFLSRSRCYELCKSAIKEMAEFMFGCEKCS